MHGHNLFCPSHAVIVVARFCMCRTLRHLRRIGRKKAIQFAGRECECIITKAFCLRQSAPHGDDDSGRARIQYINNMPQCIVFHHQTAVFWIESKRPSVVSFFFLPKYILYTIHAQTANERSRATVCRTHPLSTTASAAYNRHRDAKCAFIHGCLRCHRTHSSNQHRNQRQLRRLCDTGTHTTDTLTEISCTICACAQHTLRPALDDDEKSTVHRSRLPAK